ncbi:MAG TPA: PDZ domain-containing protein [Luteolibacter sp.]|nr:PDZ domain-containing protein [Luteolibacter sp.]
MAAAEPLGRIGFPALAGGKPCESVVVPCADPPIHVTVVPRGANPQQPTPAVRVIGHDPVSRLGFLEYRGTKIGQRGNAWLDSAAGCIGTSVTAATIDGPVPCRIAGWEKKVGGKILPLALLKVDFQSEVPPPGTPLMDERGRIAGIVFQSAGKSQTAYAIPAEAVHRVGRDIRSGGVLVRPRLGLTLNAQNSEARVVRVLPGSPAAAAGIRPGDVLLQVGGRAIRAYADVPDAFFYLIPGRPTAIIVQRGSRRIDATITPERAG